MPESDLAARGRISDSWTRWELALGAFLATAGASLAVVLFIHIPINDAIDRRPEGMPRSWALDIAQEGALGLYLFLFPALILFPTAAALSRRRFVLVVAVVYPLCVGAMTAWGIYRDITSGP